MGEVFKRCQFHTPARTLPLPPPTRGRVRGEITFWATLPRMALTDSLILGYSRRPLRGRQDAAHRAENWIGEGQNSRNWDKSPNYF